ncbi:hypothetical protein ACA910_018704 [Epithemia clementina (nom. ined.)]
MGNLIALVFAPFFAAKKKPTNKQREDAHQTERAYQQIMQNEITYEHVKHKAIGAQQQKTESAPEGAQHAREAAKQYENEKQKLLELDWGSRPSHLKHDCNSVGLVGRSGVGKSSLCNALVKVGISTFVPQDERSSYRGKIDHARVGAVETTREPLSFLIPGTFLNLVDNPGHGTVGTSSTEYIRSFGIGYYLQILYVYAGRLEEIDAMLMLNFLMYNVPFVVVRQKFCSDLETFACTQFYKDHPRYDPLFSDGEEEDIKKKYVENKIHDESIIKDCKDILRKELTNNWTELIRKCPNPAVRDNQNYLKAKLKVFFVDSKVPNKYDIAEIFSYINQRILKLLGPKMVKMMQNRLPAMNSGQQASQEDDSHDDLIDID